MKKINFLPISEEAEKFVEPPIPASKGVPSWYKQIPAFEENKIQFQDNGQVNSTVKICMPFADTLKFGYLQNTWQETSFFKTESGNLSISSPTTPQIFDARKSSYMPKSFFENYYNAEFVWKMQWFPKLPKGYSVLITHPLNRDDLPFKTLTGIIDADDYFHSNPGNLPFLLKKGFTGIIPTGTPMYQIIPFKRENWQAQKESFNSETFTNGNKIRSMFYGGYKKFIWKQKQYK